MKTAALITTGVILCFTGLSAASPTPKIPQEEEDFHFSSDPNLSLIDKHAILTAEMTTLKKHESKKPSKGQIYRVTKTHDGYDVQCVNYSTLPNGEMLFAPGQFCVVTLDKNFKVLKIVGGV